MNDNTNKNITVAVAMSGGVDSSVCAHLVKEQNFDLFGATMKLYTPSNESATDRPCGTDKDILDAKSTCDKIGIEHFVYDFSGCFKKHVIDNFTQTYIAGGTPNPCIECNRHLKFGKLLDAARKDGADMIATGHYARIQKADNGRYLLMKAKDKNKDQSYVLWSLSQDVLSHTLLPLGEYTKDEIRAIANKEGFVNANKGDSQDICFVPDGDYASFITRETGYTASPGNYLDIDGNIIGKHKGVIHYTIGQRKGLGISMGRHIFVCDKNPESNTVTLADEEFIFKKEVKIKQINLISTDKIEGEIRAEAKLRYRQFPAPCRVIQSGEDELTLIFDTPQRAPAKGQSAVIYNGDIVVGGGIII